MYEWGSSLSSACFWDSKYNMIIIIHAFVFLKVKHKADTKVLWKAFSVKHIPLKIVDMKQIIEAGRQTDK